LVEIQVIPKIIDEMIVTVVEGEEIGGVGKSMIFRVIGADQTVNIQILAADGKIIDTLSFSATAQGEIKQPWIIPEDTAPGTYTIKVTDGFGTIETDFEINWVSNIKQFIIISERMDSIVEKEICRFIDNEVGDTYRLKFILESMQNKKNIYNTDRNFLYKLAKEHTKDEEIFEHVLFAISVKN